MVINEYLYSFAIYYYLSIYYFDIGSWL